MKIRSALLLVVLVCVAESYSSDKNAFAEFMTTYGKSYMVEDMTTRHLIFQDNIEYINRENSKNKSYTLGVNQFADRTFEEIKEIFLSSAPRPSSIEAPAKKNDYEAVPKILDWRKEDAVTSVKDQGECGACWAFSSTGAVEGAFAIGGAPLISVSNQELIDCYSEDGCNGGWATQAFDYISAYGVCSEKDYPYTGIKGECRIGECTSVGSISGFFPIGGGDEEGLQEETSVGPVSVSIQANKNLAFYKTGIFDDPTCVGAAADLNHAVLTVGYVQGSHWIIKNSWAATWGEDGFARFAWGKNMCGLANFALRPVL